MKKLLLLLLAAGMAVAARAARDPQISIVPFPNQLETAAGLYALKGKPVVCDSRADEPTQRAVSEFAAQLAKVSGGKNPVRVSARVPERGIRFVVADTLPGEAYFLEVTPKAVTVAASQFRGFLYAMQSLRQLLPVAVFGNEPAPGEAWELPCVTISDAPRYAYRGMHLDVVRHFFPVEEVKRYLDVMAIHKLNTLHWHLTDDQGWRIEIKRYPELTEVGSMRKQTIIRKTKDYDNTPYGGFYTQDQIREVVQYAADRGITVIPEIDLPGHMLAALTAYPELGCTGGPYEVWGRWGVADDVLCVGQEKTFEFLENVLTEVMELFPAEYIHIGGDECPKVRWKECPRCQAKIRELGLQDKDGHTAEHYLQGYVTDRIGKFLADHGRRFIGWDEILEGEVPQDAVVMSWRGSKGGVAAAKLGHDVIMTPNSHFYFDFYQSSDPDSEPFGIGGYVPVEKVYSFDPALPELTPEQQKHVLGVQANLWTEYVLDGPHLEYMLLPRLAALSEVQWCQPEVKDWKRFLDRFRMDAIYTKMGYTFATHIFDVAATYKVDPAKGCVVMTLTTGGGAPIHYTLDGSQPTAASPLYTEPVDITRSGTFRATALREGVTMRGYSRTFDFSKSTGRPAVLNTSPTEQYTYTGASTLVDGYRGGPVFYGGPWLGYLGAPADVTIDMGGKQTYSTVEVGTLTATEDWIFPASWVSVQLSDDNEHFTEVARVTEEPAKADDPGGIKRYKMQFPESHARYLRVVVQPTEKIPAWHRGAGGGGFLFVDEVAVE